MNGKRGSNDQQQQDTKDGETTPEEAWSPGQVCSGIDTQHVVLHPLKSPIASRIHHRRFRLERVPTEGDAVKMGLCFFFETHFV